MNNIEIRLRNTDYKGDCIYRSIPKHIDICKDAIIDGKKVVWVRDTRTFLKLTRKGT